MIYSIYFNIYSISKSIDMIHTFRTVITVLPPQDTAGLVRQMIRRMVFKYHSRATYINTLGHSIHGIHSYGSNHCTTSTRHWTDYVTYDSSNGFEVPFASYLH